MPTALRGLLAGIIATAVLAVLLLLERALNLFPGLNIIQLIAAAAGELFGVPETLAAGWVLLFVIGAVWGLVFAWIFTRLPGATGISRGLVFGLAAWVVMMIVFMPIAGAGWFGIEAGSMTPLVSLVMHLIFGAVLGLCFTALPRRYIRVEKG